jgi:nitrite reductase (NADH) large subunit
VGASPFIPSIKGKQKSGIMAIRTLADADELLKRLRGKESCICIGGGVLGLEVAEAIAGLGVKVRLLEVAPWLMPRQLNPKAAALLRKQVERLGIEVTEGAMIVEFTGADACEGIRLASGEIVASDLVIVTAGIKAETKLALDAGIAVNKGIIANDRMASSIDSVLTAGDCAEHLGVVHGLWNAALSQGKIAGASAAGIESLFEEIQYPVTLKVIGTDLFSIGEFMPKEDAYRSFEMEQDGKYYLFVIRNDRVTGSIILGDRAMARRVKAAVDRQHVFPAIAYDKAERFMEHFTRTASEP